MSHWMDSARRQMGDAFDAFGLGPDEAPYRVLAELPGAHLRAYDGDGTGPALLIIPAVFKRAYLWDLAPEVSVVRRCLARGLRVFLLDWQLPGDAEDGFGLADYADRLPLAAAARVAAETGGARPLLAGHSLGGTLAAIFASLHPEHAGGLILVDAPLAFGAAGGPLAVAARGVRHARDLCRSSGLVPGSVVNRLSLHAAPEVFWWQRLADFTASLGDPQLFALHMRVERWALDECPLPSRLFEDIIEQLYRDDRFMAGTLAVGDRRTGMAALRAPVLAVVNPAGLIVPPASILSALASVPDLPAEILSYEADRGPMLQHLGPLVAASAHRRLWPKILDWADQTGRVPV